MYIFYPNQKNKNMGGIEKIDKNNEFAKYENQISKLDKPVFDNLLYTIQNNQDSKKMLTNFEIKKIDKSSINYRIGLIQIMLCAKTTTKNIFDNKIMINGNMSKDFIISCKKFYPLFGGFTEYFIKNKLTESIKQLIISNNDDNGLETIDKNGWDMIYQTVKKNKYIYDNLKSTLGAGVKFDINSQKHRTIILQLYLIGLVEAKKQFLNKKGEFVYTEYYKQNKLTNATGIMDKKTIYMLDCALSDFDYKFSKSDIVELINSQNQNYISSYIPKENINKPEVQKEIPNIKILSKKERLTVLSTKNWKDFVDNKTEKYIENILNKEIFLRCYKYLRDNLKVSEGNAAAICGNIFVESKFDPLADDGDNGTAFGLCQRRLDRLDNLKKFAKSIGSSYKKWSIQLQYILKELNSNEYKPFLNAMNNTNDVYKKTQIFMKRYERPKNDPKVNLVKQRQGFGGAVLVTNL